MLPPVYNNAEASFARSSEVTGNSVRNIEGFYGCAACADLQIKSQPNYQLLLPPISSSGLSNTSRYSGANRNGIAHVIVSQTTGSIKNHPKRNCQSYTEPTKGMNSSTIWNNVGRFFAVVPTVENFKQYLEASQVPEYKTQLGQHYSIEINQKLKQKYKNGNVQLRLPPSLSAQMVVTESIVFYRLLSGFVKCKNDNNSRSEEAGIVEKFPDNYFGTSPYSLLPFEQKIKIEINALGLHPIKSDTLVTDGEVMKEIVDKTQELKDTIENNNKLKMRVLNELKEKENTFIKRAERAKLWNSVIVKQDSSQRKDQKKTKKSR